MRRCRRRARRATPQAALAAPAPPRWVTPPGAAGGFCQAVRSAEPDPVHVRLAGGAGFGEIKYVGGEEGGGGGAFGVRGRGTKEAAPWVGSPLWLVDARARMVRGGGLVGAGGCWGTERRWREWRGGEWLMGKLWRVEAGRKSGWRAMEGAWLVGKRLSGTAAGRALGSILRPGWGAGREGVLWVEARGAPAGRG